MALVVDPEVAETSQCTCYLIDPDKGEIPDNMMCFCEGMIGTLSDSQDKKYCKEKVVKPASSELRRRYRNFDLMGEIMHTCLAESEAEEDFLVCVEREAKELQG